MSQFQKWLNRTDRAHGYRTLDPHKPAVKNGPATRLGFLGGVLMFFAVGVAVHFSINLLLPMHSPWHTPYGEFIWAGRTGWFFAVIGTLMSFNGRPMGRELTVGSLAVAVFFIIIPFP